MRVLQLICLVALISRCAADTATTNSHTASTLKINSDADAVSRVLAADRRQATRSLRQFDHDELAGGDAEDQERGISISGPVEKMVTKFRDGLNAVLSKNPVRLRASLVEQLSKTYSYADKLSTSTLKQLEHIEKLRAADIKKGVKGSKATPGGMRRNVEPFPGMSTVPRKYLESHVGRDGQRFGKDGSRLLSAGGWDKGEDIKTAALREVIEEGGVSAQLAHGLGKVRLQDGDNKYTYFAYLMKSNKVYDDWSESTRYRLWVPMDDAVEMLGKRPQLAEIVKRAKFVDAKIAAGKMPELNPRLSQVKLKTS
ncbi:NUDIX domain-containing protein [Phytophthora infestans]|uniref:NUDIX domain-containing protein n=1 Tax=Phytophthora infestans TaxID=4787 RepID=A0A833TJC4_PHYIN|nr:NUDIX domain-containing protein [Phytophthora infestans]